jgi:two-component system, response regulator YesN
MYKVVLADDEEIIREGIKTLINWEELGLELVGVAGDGISTLEFVQQLKPHILVTDVRMPGMTGLELLKELRTRNINIRIIIISGYNDFEYVKEALKYRVYDYLIKPINENELTSILRDIVREIDERIIYNINNSESIKLIKDNTFNRLISGAILKLDFFEKLNFFGMEISSESFTAIVFEIEDSKNIAGEELEFRRFSLHNICEELLIQMPVLTIFFDRNNRLVILVYGNSDVLNEEYLFSISKQLKIKAEDFLGFKVSAGIGQSVKDIMQIKQSYGEAIEALKQKFVYGIGAIIFFEKTALGESRKINLNLEKFEKSLKELDNTKAVEEIKLIFSYCFRMGSADISFIKNIGVYVIASIIKVLDEYDCDRNKVLEGEDSLLERVTQAETVEKMEASFIEVVNFVINYMKEIKINKPKKIIDDIIAYVKINYDSNLTIKSVSKVFYINPAYFGRIFKNETGENFSDFLNKIRIEKARKFLFEGDLKIYEVAEKCGYKEIDYFRLMFKKYTGINPAEFKRK